MTVTRAVEFFSGIGAFAESALSSDIQVIRSFDQDQVANRVYEHNFRSKPVPRNLDSIGSGEIPEADLWWMSPSCKPFTVRGRQKDDCDPRARSFLNLINCIPDHCPDRIVIENVGGFPGSRVYQALMNQLSKCSYKVTQVDLCSSDFGVPMRRPRCFIAASRSQPIEASPVPQGSPVPLSAFLDEQPADQLEVEQSVVERYGRSFDIVDASDPDARVICFTSGYWRCRKSSGSFIKLDGDKLRRLSAEEILKLLGFRSEFAFPEDLDLPTRWRLVGNSVDVRCVRHVLRLVSRT